MKALLPIIRRGTPGVACGAPAMTVVTSSFDLPQKEQQIPRAFIFAIIELRVSRNKLTGASLAMRNDFVY
jgi:hypothetical protein